MENHQGNHLCDRAPLSPNSTSSSNSSSSSHHHHPQSTSSNGVAAPATAPVAAASPAAPLTPKSVPRSIDANPYPTTFIQADTTSFKHVVQMLTGSAETAAKHAAGPPPPPMKNPLPPVAKATGPKKPAFKLYERRSSLKNLKMISPLIPAFANYSSPRSPMGSAAVFSPRKHPPEILSPSILDFPSLVLSPVTPLIQDPFNRSSNPSSASSSASAEDQAIAEKGFYLHPSPRSAEPPRLLPLFPETSPRLSSV